MAKTKAPAQKTPPRTPFIRLLPILIATASLMLSVRVIDIRKGFVDIPSVTVTSQLQAQQAPAQPAAAAPPPAAPTPGPAGALTPPPTAAGAQSASLPAESGGFSQTELDVLQKLGERRAGLDARERDIERREALMKAADAQIERKITEMKTLQNTIEGLLRQYNDQEDSKMRSLVKIYENMKPKEAAKIFEQLDMPIMLEVVERMKEQKVAPILAEMDPAKARTLTSELAQRRQMPATRSTTGG